MAVPGTNIRTLRTQLNLSMRDLARETGADIGNLSKLEAGKVGYSRELMERIAKALNVSLGVLFSDPGVVEAAALLMRQAPVLTTEQLLTWSGPDDAEYSDEQTYVYVDLSRASRLVFAIQLHDSANNPDLREGDELIFDARGKPVTGDFVIAQDDTGSVHIGRLRPLSESKQGAAFEIVVMNDFVRSVSSLTTPGLKLRGILVEIRRIPRA